MSRAVLRNFNLNLIVWLFPYDSSPTEQLETLSHAIPMLFGIRYATIPQLGLAINTPESFFDIRFNTLQLLSKAIGRYVVLSPQGSCSLPPRPSSYLSDHQLIESMVLFDGPEPFREHYTTWENCYLMVIATVLWTDLQSATWRAVLCENSVIPLSVRRAHVFLNHLRTKESWATESESKSTYNNICRVLLSAWENVLIAAYKQNDRCLVHQAIDSGMMFCLEHMSCFGEPRFIGQLITFRHYGRTGSSNATHLSLIRRYNPTSGNLLEPSSIRRIPSTGGGPALCRS